MSNAITLNEKLDRSGEIALPENLSEINAHNLYLYVKSYQAALRANTASAKTRSEVSGGGKKPWGQKGRGGARAGSITSPIFTGGGATFAPKPNRNYSQKVNKKQKKLALLYAINEHASRGSLFVVDSIAVESGKTKDAIATVQKLNVRDVLVVKELLDEKTFLAFRNLQNAYVVEQNELNGYVAAAYHSILIEKSVLENILKES
jgi:large subunit ribosomal protein L4